ncbi:MAG TPA: S8 family serine peptidase [Gemmatimonadales bacterium]|nr:S8 family serine peptidase [Gemmatimonadales bacterium]
MTPSNETMSRARVLQQLPASVTPSDRHVVTFKTTEPASFAKSVKALGGTVVRRQKVIGAAEVTGLTDAAAVSLSKTTGVSRVDCDLILQWIPAPQDANLRLSSLPNPVASGTDQSDAAFFPFQWNIRQVQADQAWGASNGGAGRTVCLLDSGIDPEHIDIVGRVDLMTSVITTPVFPGDLDPLDYNSHGTLNAGFIASNGIGVASVSPDARLCSIKVLRVTGSGSFGDIIAGVVLAAQSGAGVINMSLGLYIDKTIPGVEGLRSVFARAVAFARDKGVVVVASAGNDAAHFNEDGNMIAIPAQIKGVVAVGATAPFNQQNFDMLASYSNFGNSGVDLFAPGGDLLPGGNQLDLVLGPCSHFQLTLPFECSTSDYLIAAGTSEAAPHVSAAAAVVESQFPGPVKPNQVVECILGNTDIIGPASVFGAGRLNVLKAAGCAKD